MTYPACKIAKNSECSPNDLSGAPTRTVSHGYTNGFLTSVGGFASSITYHANEMIASVVHPNGVTDLFELDPNAMRRPARIRTTGVPGGSNFDTGTYAYDGAGNVKSIGADVFTYDGVSRLVQGTAQQGAFAEASVHDAFGNRVRAETFPVGSRSIDVSASTNRLLGSPSRPVDYDDRGNQTRWGTAFYRYDAADRMSLHEDTPAGIDRSFVYTADDERIVVIDNSVPSETWSLRDLDGRVLREFFRLTGDTDWQKDTIHRQGQVLATDAVEIGVRHAHLDHLGTIRLWTGPGGSSQSHHTYTAFGEEIPDNFDGQKLRFTGHERDVARSGGCTGTTTVDNQTLSTGQVITGCDELTSTNTTITSAEEVRFRAGDLIRLEEFAVENGAVFAAEVDGDLNSNLQDLDYMHARFCSPGTGRFLSVDPAEERQALKRPQKWNRYAYVENNPLAFVDPDGEESVGITQDILLQSRLRGEITPEEHRAALAARAIGASVGAAGAFAILAAPGTAALFGAGELLVPVAPVVSNPNLQRVVRELFKSSDRLPGGTAGALRSEALTGRMLSRSPTGHIQAAALSD